MAVGKISKGRKTYEIQNLITTANDWIKYGAEAQSIAEREMLASFVSHILMETDNYNGCNYLQDLDAPDFDRSRIFFYGPYHKKATK